MTSRFIREGLYEPDQLSSLNEKMLEKMKIEIKVGPQIKLLKEIESFKKKVEERKAEEDRKRAEEKKNRQRPPDEDEDETVRHDADKVREELGIVDGKWEIDTTELEYTKLLGSGASGKVYKGLFKGKEVAIKVLTNIDVEETLDEFKKEFQIMTTVRSPYMVHFYGAGLNKKLCMVLEYCQRGSLYHVMNEKQFTWSWDTTFRFALDMAHGMDVLHNWNPAIVHRDLKSLNLLVTTDMRVKVCDFGLSRSTAGNLETFKKLCGTFAYCAPEVCGHGSLSRVGLADRDSQIFNGGTFTNRSDVFSMGIVIWELLIRSLKGKYEQPYSEYKNLTYDFQIMVQAAGGLRPTLPEGTPASFLQLYKDCTDVRFISGSFSGLLFARSPNGLFRRRFRSDLLPPMSLIGYEK
jgi:serine/threonine protein kinase